MKKFTFTYLTHGCFTLPSGEPGGHAVHGVCLFCTDIIDGAKQDATSYDQLPKHCGPGVKRRRMSDPLKVNQSFFV